MVLRESKSWNEDEDVQSILEIQSGDESAFGRILDRYEKRLHNFFYRFCGNAQTAEDLTQRLFVQLYQSIPRYQPRAKFSTYLYRMAKNLAINNSRRNSILSFFSLSDLPPTHDPVDSKSRQPDFTAEQSEKIAQVQKAMGTLPDRQRMAVILFYYDECSMQEIADRMDCSVSSVEAMLFRARQSLKQKLSGYLIQSLMLVAVLLFTSQIRAVQSGNNDVLRENLTPSVETVALLVIPAGDGATDSRWMKTLEKYQELRLTVAYSPQDFSQIGSMRETVIHLIKRGKLEIALRLSGDPPLPLIYDLDLAKMFLEDGYSFPSRKIAWPEDVTGQIIKGKIIFKAYWGNFPKGFVPGGGSLNLAIAELLKKQKFSWSVAGFPEGEWSVGESLLVDQDRSNPLWIYGAHPASNVLYEKSGTFPKRRPDSVLRVEKIMEEIQINPSNAQIVPVIVFDERRSQIPLNDFLMEWATQFSSTTGIQMALCSEIGEKYDSKRSLSFAQIWPFSWSWIRGLGSPRGPGLTAWVGDPGKNAAWDFLSRVREDIDQYRNSGKAVIERLDKAVEEFYLAQSGEFLEWFGSHSGQDQADGSELQKQSEKRVLFKVTLANVYRHLGVQVPEFLQGPSMKLEMKKKKNGTVSSNGKPTKGIGSGEEVHNGEGDGFTESGGQDKIFVQQTSHSIVWIRPDEPGSREEEKDRKSGPEIKNHRSVLREFLVETSTIASEDNWIQYQFKMNDKTGSASIMDLYIDINHRSGAGSTELLSGRNASVVTDDGWEFVLSCQWSPMKIWECNLYRANGAHSIYHTTAKAVPNRTHSSGEMAANKNSHSITVKVPKNRLGEKPLQWGYLLCLMDELNGPITDFMSLTGYRKEILSQISDLHAGKTDEHLPILPMMRSGSH